MADAGDVFEATARMVYNSTDDIQNVWQFALVTPGTLADSLCVDDIVEIVDEIYYTIRTILSVLVVARDIVVRLLDPPTVFGSQAWDTFTAGTGASDPTPAGAAGLTYFGTSVPHVIPKKFWGVLTETSVNSAGQLATTSKTLINTVCTDLMSNWAGTNGVWRYGYWSPKTLSFVTPTTFTTTSIFAYQRRRREGRGS